MRLQPSLRVHNELDTHQLQVTVRRWLIDQGLGLRSVGGSVEQIAIDVVNAHRSMVGAANAAKKASLPATCHTGPPWQVECNQLGLMQSRYE